MSQPARSPQSKVFSPGTLVLCGMVAFTVAYRLLVHFAAGAMPYNFTPVEAMALFGGAYFANRKLAIAVPLVAMACADLVIAFSLPWSQVTDWLMVAPVIYGCVALTAFAGFALRGRVRVWNTLLAAAASATGFYLVTNFFTWATTTMYPHSLGGLAACYIAGWPFYQYGTLPGTLLWSALLFGGFALLSHRWTGLRLTAAH
ncbi:MAG: hypothetical protein EPN40_10935 [Rhodanobacteraceae bacterium]|nr:MAG: hypothetical protein EPN40_10935 [Rhodanobacteraceae bacterium]